MAISFSKVIVIQRVAQGHIKFTHLQLACNLFDFHISN